MKDFQKINRTSIPAVFILGGITVFSIALFFLLRKKSQSPIEPNPNQNNLNMERYVFSLPTDNGESQAVVEAGGECYGVHLDGKYIGSMWQDEHKGMQWETKDAELEPHMWEIAVHLSEAFSRKGIPSLLMGTYPEIVSTDWKSSETLEVTLKSDTDMEVFTTFLKDEVLNLVTFEEHLDLMVKKEDDAYFIIIGIN